MAEFIFKGAVDTLSFRQKEFISEILEKQGFESTEVTIETVGKAGDNYMANVIRIITQDNNGKVFKMIVKIAPANEIARKRTKIHKLFGNEAIMYVEVLPKLVELQVDARVPKEDLLRCAKCYGVLLEQPYELILLEDLQLSNFMILDRFKPLKDNVVRLILKNFAIMHSMSLVWKKQNPEAFSTFKTKLIDVFGSMGEEDDFAMYATNLEKDAVNLLSSEKYKMAVRNTMSKIFVEDTKEVYADEADLPQSVIIQGDGWTNNIMFKLEDDEPVECILIDYQLSKVSCPSFDILYMIFNCTDHETRLKYYYDWIQYYYFELDKSLTTFGMKVDLVYPRDQLDADLFKYSKILFPTSIIISSLLIRKAEDAAKVKEAMSSDASPEEVMQFFETNNLDDESVALFKSRIEGIIDSYREFGYINDFIEA